MATSSAANEASTSSSSSSTSKRWIYEVFLSFRGEDTRNNFTGHLYMALKDAGINAFMDNNELRRGGNITEELVQAILGSRISAIVFSTRYADSSWCLEELVKIMECRTELGQIVLPVFYDVDPSDVRKQTGRFAESFNQKHKDIDEDKVKRWRAALTEAADLSGWDLRNTAEGHEGKLIRTLIDEISRHLNHTSLHVANNQVGIDSRVQEIISNYLGDGTSHDVRIVGICGMGGIGKTTVAKALYNKFCHSFEASSFLADVRETMQKDGKVSLQESLLSDISKTTGTKVSHVDRGINVIKNRLGCRRVFVVIDDVDQVEQLEALAIDRDSFGPGSRILITTRDGHLLKQLGVDAIYRAQEMNEEEALELFSLHAFKACCPNEGYLELSRSVVDCCGGLPIALKVLGSFLVGKSTIFWESTMKKLKKVPQPEIQEKLKISFEGLNDDTEREIFLDISCFFIGEDMDYVKQILDSCDFFPDSGIEVLIQRCLVTVNDKNKLMMHDLLRDMGREIVREKCRDNPGKWSRVWSMEDAIEVLREESGSEEIQGLVLHKQANFRTEAFANMKRLRLLQLTEVRLSGNYKYISNKLRWLCWRGFPLEFIPEDFNLGQAVAIDLKCSKLTHLFEDTRLLEELKILNLSFSRYLSKSPDFSGLPNLETLILVGCERLSEVHQSIGHLDKLAMVNLSCCIMLKQLPRSFYKLKSVKTLVLTGCREFQELDEDIGEMESLTTLLAESTMIRRLPSSIVRLKHLARLSVQYWSTPNCYNLMFTPSPQGLSSSVELTISGCSLTNFPRDFETLSSLESLTLRNFDLQSLPSLGGLFNLEILVLDNCSLTDDAIIQMDIGSLSSLKRVSLQDNSFGSLPSLTSLSKLEILNLRGCRNLLAIPDLPTSLMILGASHCTALEILPDFSEMSNMRRMFRTHSAKLIEVPGLDKSLRNSMRLLVMEGCANITATFKEKILQGWNFIGPGGIFLPWSDIPELFTWVNKGGKINFQVPQNMGSNVIAFTLCFTCFHIVHFNRSYFANDPDVLVTNHTKRTCFWTAPFYRDRKDSTLCEHLWLGHLPNYKFNMEGGDLVEVLVRTVSPYFKVKRTGLSLVWDTKQADFRVDANWVDKMCSSRPYVGGPADYDDEHKQYVL